MQNDTLALPIGGCGTSFRLARDAAASHFLNTGMLPFPEQNAYFGSPYWELRHLISPCTRCCRQPLPQRRNASISYAKGIIWLSLLGAAVAHFALRAMLPPATSQHRNATMSHAKRILWLSQLGAAAPHFALRAMLPPATCSTQESYHFHCKTHTSAFPIGGCGTSFRLVRDAAVSHFLNTGMLAFPMQNAYFGSPYWGLRHLISPCVRCCRQTLPQHRDATISSHAKRMLWLSLLGAAEPHFALHAMLPPATSSKQECYQFQCKTYTLAVPIGGCGTSFRLCASTAFRTFHNTGILFLYKMHTLAFLTGAAATSDVNYRISCSVCTYHVYHIRLAG